MRTGLTAALVVIGLWWLAMFFLALGTAASLPRQVAGQVVHTIHYLLPFVGLISCGGIGAWFSRKAAMGHAAMAIGVFAVVTFVASLGAYVPMLLAWFFVALGTA